MSSDIKKAFPVPENVCEFLDKASHKYGAIKEERFSQVMWGECCHIGSPIEQLFIIGIGLVCAYNLTHMLSSREFGSQDRTLYVIPQWKIDSYHVDFALRYESRDKIVCVELDGHEFHDRNERQRRYEKQRDRYLTKSGYKVLHFTGSEIVKDPCAAALEAFVLATDLHDIAAHPFEE